MITPSSIKLAAAAGGVAAALALGAGIAAAGPDDSAVNTTCTYPQVVAALHDQSPGAAGLFDSTPIAQQFMQSYIASPPPQREQMLQQLRGIPEAAQFVGLIQPLANTCKNYPVS